MSAVSITPVVPEPLALNEPGFLYEIVDGEIREIPHMGTFAGIIASVLANFLNEYAHPRNLGLAVVEVLFRLGKPATSRRPDVAFVKPDKLLTQEEALDDPPQWEIAPNLAVEVVSKTNTAAEIEDKLADYFLAGVELVWVIYPRHRRIYVYESITKNSILTEQDELSGGNVIPGFRLRVDSLFNTFKPRQ